MTPDDHDRPEPVLGPAVSVTVELLLASPRSRYVGRPADGAAPASGPELHDEVRVRAGLGIVGDRYFNQPAHRSASVTLFAAEQLDHVAEALGTGPLDAAATRRNVVLRGLAVDGLRSEVVALDCGAGPVRFAVHRPAAPCAWMDVELAPGAFRALRGRGGVRCTPLDDGVLRTGPAEARATVPIGPPTGD